MFKEEEEVQKMRKGTVPVSVSFISSQEDSYTVHLEHWLCKKHCFSPGCGGMDPQRF